MRRHLTVLALLLLCGPAARAHGLLIPEEKSLPPLAMLNHTVTITIEDQVAVTRVEQTFRNHTSRDLEATYVFPCPRARRWTSSPCGSTARRPRPRWSAPRRPARST